MGRLERSRTAAARRRLRSRSQRRRRRRRRRRRPGREGGRVARHRRRPRRRGSRPRDRKASTDAIVRITSTAICGSDLHLLGRDGPVHRRRRFFGHEPMGIVEEVGSEAAAHLSPGGPGGRPVQHLLWELLDVRGRAAIRPVRDHAESRIRNGRLALRLHQALRTGARRPGGVPPRAGWPTSGRSRCQKGRRTSVSSSSPTSCPQLGRRSSTPTSPTAAASPFSGSARSGSCRPGSPRTAALA